MDNENHKSIMIHDEICTYEVAKLAKEKGFNDKCYHYYQKGELQTDKCFNRYNKGVDSICSAPNQSLLQRWLREEKGLHITIPFDNNEFWWQIKILANGDSEYGEALGFDTYELALEDAELYCLKNLL